MKLAGAVLLVLLLPPSSPAPVVLRERGEQRAVCVEYTTASAPRQPNRSCVEADRVRAWILQNGRTESCE